MSRMASARLDLGADNLSERGVFEMILDELKERDLARDTEDGASTPLPRDVRPAYADGACIAPGGSTVTGSTAARHAPRNSASYIRPQTCPIGLARPLGHPSPFGRAQRASGRPDGRM